MTQPETAAPTAGELDELAKDFLAAKEKHLQSLLATAKLGEEVTTRGNVLRDYARKFGSSHHQKSKLLHGLDFEVMVTFGSSTSIDNAAVDLFLQALRKAGKTRTVKKLFDRTIRWTLNPEASKLIRSDELSKKLAGLWAKCHVITPQTPRLEVREKKAA